MGEPNSLLVVAIVLASLGAIFLALRAVTVWMAPPSSGPRRRWLMLISPEAEADAGWGDDGGSTDHAGGGGGHGGDAAGEGGH